MRSDEMWIPLHSDKSRSKLLLPIIAKELCTALDAARDDSYLVRHHLLGGEYDMFGRMVWPMAHYGAIGVLTSLAAANKSALPPHPDVDRCRDGWLTWLVNRTGPARQVAADELAEKVIPQVVRFSRRPPDADLGHILSVLDVYEFFALGADSVWPGFDAEARLARYLREALEQWLPSYKGALSKGGFEDESGTIYWPLTLDDLRREEIAWLPTSFWWRHLPELLQPGLTDVEDITA